MRVLLVEHAGFCFGVKNAIETVLRASARGSVCTLGELIHNRRTVDELALRGIFSVDSPQQVATRQVVIRSHGAAPETYEALSRLGVEIVDATCPFVRRIHEKARALARDGIQILVIGQKEHPEIVATMGWAGPGAVLIDSMAQACALRHYERACVIGQTTYSMEKRDLLLAEIARHVDELEVFNFVCATTSLRQKEVLALRSRCDTVLVVGDWGSANTRKLYELARQGCQAYLIADAQDPVLSRLDPDSTCGITGGASAPPQALEEIVAGLKARYSCVIETIAT